MTRVLFAALIIILLAGIATAEPQPVDGGWQRSDEAPQETPTAPPPEEMPAPTAAPPETATHTASPLFVWGVVGIAAAGGLILLWRWLQGDAKR